MCNSPVADLICDFKTVLFIFHRDVELGDIVVIGQCRPLSKTLRFNVVKFKRLNQGKNKF